MNLIKQSITWNSYGYLSGDGSYASTAPVDWLQYADVTYNGNKYRAVRFSQYRPEQTRLQCSAANSLQDDNGYSSGTVYWFKYEPIKWRVLDPSTGLVLSEVCLDAREYSAIIRYDYYYQSSYISAYYDDEGWANRYEHNNQIRHWLNNTFLAYVRESSGYAFSSSLTAKINGNTANVQPYSSHKTVWYCFGKTGSGSVKTLSSISVTTQPNKKIYAAGENFNKAGMVVKANYSDGTSATITGYTVTDGNNLTAGKTSVTLSYTEGGVTKTATVAITVSSSTATLTGIEITSPPAKTSYNYKSSVSTAGLKVTAKYSDNTTKDVTDQVSVSGFDTTQKGTFNATVKLEDKTATFSYTVSYAWWQWIIKIVLFGWIWY